MIYRLTIPAIISLLLNLNCIAQINPKAQSLQQRFKNHNAYAENIEVKYTFSATSNEQKIKVKEEKSTDLISLRYNTIVNEIEVYDQNSEILKFYGESSLKQKAIDLMKFCGKYTHEGFFYDDSKFCSHKINLKEVGETWNIKSIKETFDSRYFTSVYFEGSYPTAKKIVTFVIPENIEVELREFNFDGYTITKSNYKEGKNNIIEYTANELEGSQSERFNRGVQYFRPHILVLVKSITTAKGKTNILANTADLYSWYKSLVGQLNPKPELLKPTVDRLTQNKTNDEEKIQSIFYWVQDNIRYIAFENGIAGFKPDEAHSVFEKKYGDCKGMANLLTEMLKIAGYDARLTWIGTNIIRYDYSIPSLAVDNHMICTIILNNKKYFLDATEKYIPLNEYAYRIQDREVMIENGNNYIIEKVPNSNPSKDFEIKKFKLNINDLRLHGHCELILNGENRKDFLYGYNYSKSEDRSKYTENQFSEGIKNISISDITLPELNDRKQALLFTGKASLENYISKFNNEMYIDADPTKDFKSWEIKNERQSDVDFGRKIYSKLEIEITLPADYTLNTLPENLTIKEEEFLFNIQYKKEGDKIIYIKEIEIHKGIISKSNFKIWNESIKKLNKTYESPVILKK